jgi:glucose/arabinose dehydrogenase
MPARWLGLALAPLVAGVAHEAGSVPVARGLATQLVASGLEMPVYLTSPPGDRRLFIVELPGRIRIVDQGRLEKRPFLDLTDRVRSGGERGLLSVAFHPRFAENGRLFVYYTGHDGALHIERYTANRQRTAADPASAHSLIVVPHRRSNHNGGLLLFGPDGMLWAGLGDGGGAGDPDHNGQNRATLLGKLLRIDVDHGDPYAIPTGNPFARQTDARAEVWAYGLRNPWRFCFDRETRQLVIADVGQNRWEEIDAVPDTAAGLDFGWNLMEGLHRYQGDGTTAGLTPPVLEYGHDAGCSIIGGFVYRGAGIPALRGAYLFSDYCSGWLRSVRLEHGRAIDPEQWSVPSLGGVTSFGQDASGELYVCSANGRVVRLVAAPGAR